MRHASRRSTQRRHRDPTPSARVASLIFQEHGRGRFPPGTLLAQRYRIVILLGRGGMGEVYRANDLLLGQTVALKFLPVQWTSDEATLARFRNEVRIARQISHPNVCRVYDIGEAEGTTYLSMEYVDGEDLASLLRRDEAAGSEDVTLQQLNRSGTLFADYSLSRAPVRSDETTRSEVQSGDLVF